MTVQMHILLAICAHLSMGDGCGLLDDIPVTVLSQ